MTEADVSHGLFEVSHLFILAPDIVDYVAFLKPSLLLASVSYILLVSSYLLGFSFLFSPVDSIYFTKPLNTGSSQGSVPGPLILLLLFAPLLPLFHLVILVAPKFISLALSFGLKTCKSNYSPVISIWMFAKVKIFPHKLASPPVFSALTNLITQTHSLKNPWPLHLLLLVNQLVPLSYPLHCFKVHPFPLSLLLLPYSKPWPLKYGP